MKHSGKVVVVSSSGYAPDRDDALLKKFIESKTQLCCFAGLDAEEWEEALDWLCIGADGQAAHFIVTTAHPNESVDEVIEFAEMFSTDETHKVEVIYV